MSFRHFYKETKVYLKLKGPVV